MSSSSRLVVVVALATLGFALAPAFGEGKRPIVVQADGTASPAPVNDEDALKNAGVGTDGPSLVEFFKKATLEEKDLERIQKTIVQLGDEDFDVREKASRDLIAIGYKAHPMLRKAREHADPEIADRASLCLKEMGAENSVPLAVLVARRMAATKPEGSTSVLLKFLPQAESEHVEDEVIAAIGATGVKEGKADAALVAAIKDAKPICRAAAAQNLGPLSDPELRKSIRGLLSDADAKVRFRAAQGLVAGKDKEAIPALLALLTDSPQRLAWQAEELLCYVAGDKAPPLSVGSSDAERKKCRDAWEAWWKEESAKVDLANLDPEKRTLGYTLVCVFDNNTDGMGRLVELGTDGKPRWEIKNVQGAIDAQVLPGNRVLYAEHNSCKVIEREISGKVVWEYRVANGRNVVACQRLANGNTIVATYNSVHEINPERKEVWSFVLRSHTIYHARKLRDGTIAAASSNGTMLLFDEKGSVKKQSGPGPFSGWMSVEELPGGRVLVPFANKLVEFDRDGKEVATVKLNRPAFAASRNSNGNFLVCSHNDFSVYEYDRTGKEIGKHTFDGRPFWAKKR